MFIYVYIVGIGSITKGGLSYSIIKLKLAEVVALLTSDATSNKAIEVKSVVAVPYTSLLTGVNFNHDGNAEPLDCYKSRTNYSLSASINSISEI
jgi:hypothetical protein